MSHDLTSFFLPDRLVPKAGENYRTIRDGDGNALICRAEVDRLWAGFQDVCPENPDQFRKQAGTNFLGQVWPMWLVRLLRSAGFKLEKTKKKGPDLTFLHGGRRYWIECTAPKPSSAEDGEYLKSALRQGAGTGPRAERMRLLRMTHSLAAKRKCFADYEAEGLVSPGDVRVVAISTGDLPGADTAPSDGLYPEIVKSFFGVGDLGMALPIGSGDEDEVPADDTQQTGYTPRKSVQKGENLEIPCTPFEGDESYNGISGVYHQATSLWHLLGRWNGLDFLHNPRASASVPLGELPCVFEYTKDPDAVERFVQVHDRRERWKACFTG